jgi:hypothetical protein
MAAGACEVKPHQASPPLAWSVRLRLARRSCDGPPVEQALPRAVHVLEPLLMKGTVLISILRRSTGAIIVAASLAFSAAGAAQAQEYDQQKLESFVVAALEVNRLVEQWTPRIQGATDESEAAQMRDQANGELVSAINQADGITIDEYREISQAAQADPTLMERIAEIFDDMQPPQQQ